MRSAPTRLGPRMAARRLRRRIRIAFTAAVLGAVAVTGAVVVLPAEAAPVAPKVKLAAGDGAITAGWSAVTGASSYTVRLSHARSLSHARVVTTTKRAVKLAKLKNGARYYVGVTANRTEPTATGAAVTPAAVHSPVVTTTAAKGVPFAVSTVKATSGPAANQVTVSWTGGGRALKVAVVGGLNVTTNMGPFHSAWYPATTRSITLTVPAKYRSKIGAGTGNPVWVKVVQSNSGSSAYGYLYSYARKYRASPSGTWAFAKAVPPAPASVDKLVVAELNTQSVGATAGFHAVNRWPARAPRLARYINDTSPDIDVLLTAELATNVTNGCSNTGASPYRCRSHTQVADLAKRLTGLKLADTDTYDRVMDQQRSATKWRAKVTNGAHVFYDPKTVELLDHGYYAPALPVRDSFDDVEGLGVSPWSLAKSATGGDRWLTWAELRVRSSGRVFYALAAHFPVGLQKSVVDARAAEAKKVIAAIRRRAGNLPIVFGGDLNSDSVRTAEPVQPAFVAAGWMDAAAVSAKHLRTGMKVSTSNGSGPQNGADPGYGSKPNRLPYETSRIDYILLKNSPHTYTYANVLRVDKHGRFIKSQQGTDHNMQLATIGIGDPVTAS